MKEKSYVRLGLIEMNGMNTTETISGDTKHGNTVNSWGNQLNTEVWTGKLLIDVRTRILISLEIIHLIEELLLLHSKSSPRKRKSQKWTW